MTVVVEARYGISWNYTAGSSGWGLGSLNLIGRTLGAMLNTYLLSDTITSPPSSPTDGDTYYLPPGNTTGVWSAQSGKIASWQNGGWQYYAVPKGQRAYINSRTGFFWYNGAVWTVEQTGSTGGTGSEVTSVAGKTGDVSLTADDVSGVAHTTDLMNLVHTSDLSNYVTTSALATYAKKDLSNILDPSAALEGDIMVYGSNSWQRLGPGTAGQVLYSGGPNALPGWGDAGTGGGGGGGGGGATQSITTINDLVTVNGVNGTNTDTFGAPPATLHISGGHNPQNNDNSIQNRGAPVVIEGGAGTYFSGRLVLKGGAYLPNDTNTSYIVPTITIAGASDPDLGVDILIKGKSYTSGYASVGAVELSGGDAASGNSGQVRIKGGKNGGRVTGEVDIYAGYMLLSTTDQPDSYANGSAGSITINGGNHTGEGETAYTGARAGSIILSPGLAHSQSLPSADLIFRMQKKTGSQIGQRDSLVIIENCPTVDPHVVGAVWSNAGVLSISAG